MCYVVPGLCIRTVFSNLHLRHSCTFTYSQTGRTFFSIFSLIKFTLLSTAFIIKILIEHVGGFSHRSSTSYIIFVKLYNLFEHNTDYLMSCPTSLLLCMPSSSSNSTWGSNATRATSLAIHVLRGEVCWSLDPALCARNATLWRHYMT